MVNSSFKLLKSFFFVFVAVILVEVLLIFSFSEIKSLPSSTNSYATSINVEYQNSLHSPFSSKNRLLTNSSNGNKDDTDDFTYNNPDDTYSPSQFVTYGHKFTGLDFAVSMEYITRLLYAPIVTFGLGFLAVVFTYFGLLCRCCFDCCRCLPNMDSPHFERDRFCLSVFYFVLCILVLIIDQLVFIGNQSVDTGVKTIKSDIKTLGNYLTLVQDDSNSLAGQGGTMLDHYKLAETSCTYASASYEKDIQSFIDSMNSITKDLGTVTDNVDLITNYIDQYAIFYRNIGLYVVWGLAIVCVFFFLGSKFCENICITKTSIGISSIVYILFLILGIPWLLIVSFGGDLCMAPSYNIIKNIPIDMVQNISLYYSTCQGTSLLNGYVTSGTSTLETLNKTVTTLLSTGCKQDQNLENIQVDIVNIFATTDDINSLLGCPPIQYLWFDVINKGFCQDLYQGFFYIWGSQLVTSFLLFSLIVISTFLYQYYDIGKISPAEDDESEDGDEEAHLSPVPRTNPSAAEAHKIDTIAQPMEYEKARDYDDEDNQEINL
jgi:hypothetical protein